MLNLSSRARDRHAHPGTTAARTATAILLLQLCGVLQAQEPSLDRAAELISRHEAATAYAELLPQEDQRAGQPDFDYLFGVAALDSGHVTRAILALERVTAVSPGNHPARAELARAYLVAGETENARGELARIPRSEIPGEAAASLDRVLGVIDEVAPSDRARFSGYVEIGGGRDGNVNSAANAGQFAIPAFGGLLFTVAPGSGRESDTFSTVAAGGSVQVPLRPGWRMLASVGGRSTFNRHVHEMNSSVLDGTLALTRATPSNEQTLALQTSGAWVSSSVYRTANGLSAQWQSQLDEASQAGVFAQWSRQEYAGQAQRNTDRSVLGTSYARSFAGSGALAYGSLYVADERARQHELAHFGHRALGFRLGGEKGVAEGTVLFAEWQHERRRYGGAEPLFDMRRHDRQNDVLAGVRHALAPQWQVIAQARYTRAASDVVIYDYTRTVWQLSLRKEFM